MAGVFPRTQKNSNLKALVENALLPFAHLRLNQQVLSDGQDNISPRRFNQPSYMSSKASNFTPRYVQIFS